LIRWTEEGPLPLEPQELRERLESILRTMVSWNRSDMRMYDNPYWPPELTKERLIVEQEKYPVLRLD